MSLIAVSSADEIILGHCKNFGNNSIPFDKAEGRILAEDLFTDRSLPPYDRVTMDGIAISYQSFISGVRKFRIAATMGAGDAPVSLPAPESCIEIMTGCALPPGTDTIIRYEDLVIDAGIATLKADSVKQGANVHKMGSDKASGAMVVPSGICIDHAVVGVAASIGRSELSVKALPRVLIVSTGDELVDVTDEPGPFQIRRSNSHTIKSVLGTKGIDAALLHINDDPDVCKALLAEALEKYDVILLSGGVSMGRFDFVPEALAALGVTRLFHKVKQRPGKPFWFGEHLPTDTTIFAFPGNPVSAFLCLYRYFLPWLDCSLGVANENVLVAQLGEDVTFVPELTYFLQVKIHADIYGQLIADPFAGNGSGDFSNLIEVNAFMELPAERTNFKQGECFRVWPFKQIFQA